MDEQVRAWLVRNGFPEDHDLTPMQPGLGATTLWKVSQPPPAAPLVVRLFRDGSGAAADREYLAMRAAMEHQLPVPTVIARDQIDGRPVMITTFAPGLPAAKLLRENPESARHIGAMMGRELGRLHQVAAPPDLAPSDQWIERGGDALASMRPLLEPVPHQDRLLHLDYHPNNILMANGEITAIVDWENALPGPPHMDLARSRAIVQSAKLGGLFPAELGAMLDQFESGLVDGHREVVGPDPLPELSAAWGLSMAVDDLTGHLGKPDSWVTEDILDRLRDMRDASIASVTSG